MKRPPNPVLKAPIDYTPRGQKKEEEITLTFKPCCICNKAITDGYYGRWGDSGTCSKKCEQQQEKKREEHSLLLSGNSAAVHDVSASEGPEPKRP